MQQEVIGSVKYVNLQFVMVIRSDYLVLSYTKSTLV